MPIIRLPVQARTLRLELLALDPFSTISVVATSIGPTRAGALLGPVGDRPPALVSQATLELLGAEIGDFLTLSHSGRSFEVALAGVVAASQSLDRRILIDIGQAQQALGLNGWVTELLAPDGYQHWIEKNLPKELVWQTTEQRRDSARQLTEGMRANLTAMSLLALATGLFVVYSVLSFLMVQRRRMFGLLRALGLSHSALARMVLGETLVLAALGALAGLVIGTLLADRLLALVAAPVAEIYGQLPLARSSPSAGLYAAILVAVLLAAMVVAVPVLREALKIPPGRLLRRLPARLMPLAQLLPLSIALGLVSMVWIALDDRLVAALGGLFLLLIGLVLLIPPLGFSLLGLIARLFPGTLAGRGLRLLTAARKRLAPAMAALSLALALAMGMGMMILGFRAAVDQWVENLLRADVYVQASGGSIGPDMINRITTLDGVETFSSVRSRRLVEATQVAGYRLPQRAWDGFSWIAGNPKQARARFESGQAVLLSEPFARRTGLSVDDPVSLALPGGEKALPVAAIFRDYGSERGFIAINDRLYRAAFNDPAVDSIGLYLKASADAEGIGARLQALDGGESLVWITPRQIREQSLAIFDRTFRISWALAMLIGVIALIALTSALLAQGLERAREYATLRALGLSPMRLAGLVTAQTAGLTAIALILAVPMAIIIHYSLTLLIQPRAFGWTVPSSLPPMGPILVVVPLALLIGTLAGLYPAWRIAGRPPIRYLRAAP
ncbi:MAG: ABC transporter permease [Xanthomonadaceae bacterium]|nr:ABC transporter permease [Xanthomonadaceae bacterium]